MHSEVEICFHICFRVLHLHPSIAQFKFSCLPDTLVHLSLHISVQLSLAHSSRQVTKGVGTGTQACHDQGLHL